MRFLTNLFPSEDLNYSENSRLCGHLNFRLAPCFASRRATVLRPYPNYKSALLSDGAHYATSAQRKRAKYRGRIRTNAVPRATITRSPRAGVALIQKSSYSRAVVRNVSADGNDSPFRQAVPRKNCDRLRRQGNAPNVGKLRFSPWSAGALLGIVSPLYYSSFSSSATKIFRVLLILLHIFLNWEIGYYKYIFLKCSNPQNIRNLHLKIFTEIIPES